MTTYVAAWGRYDLVREAAGKLVLRDVERPGAYVVVDLDRVGRDYQVAPAAQHDIEVPIAEFCRVTLPTECASTLGATRPGHGYRSLPGVESLSWIPCLTQAPDGAGSHAWFISSNLDAGRLRCYSCRPLVLEATAGGSDLEPLPPAVPPPSPPPPVITPWRAVTGALAAEVREYWTERASICEYLGGLARADAEASADEQTTAWWAKRAA